MKIEDICTRICSGGTPKSGKAEYYENGTIPWLNTKEINFNRIQATETFITEEGLNNSSAKWIKPHAVIVAMYGATAGRVAVAEIPLATNQACCNLEVDETIADYRYIYYWLKQNYDNIAGLANGGAQQNLSAKVIRQIEINLPDLIKQRSIANFLDRFDSKIETNAKLNGYLEELLLAKCADLENAVEESCTVGDYCKRIYSGGTPSTKIPSYWNGTLPWLSSGETRARFIIGAEKTITPEGIEGSSTKLANRGSIVMASAGQGFTRGQTSMLLFDTYVNQSVVVMVPEEKCGSYLLFALAARYEELRAWSDSTSTRGSLSGKILRRFALPCLTKEQLERFESLANPLIRVIESNLRESKSLAKLRDALLPKLMSGEIDVSKVDLTQLNSHLA